MKNISAKLSLILLASAIISMLGLQFASYFPPKTVPFVSMAFFFCALAESSVAFFFGVMGWMAYRRDPLVGGKWVSLVALTFSGAVLMTVLLALLTVLFGVAA